jgi:tetratricopeptide (TPR) repeat protein
MPNITSKTFALLLGTACLMSPSVSLGSSFQVSCADAAAEAVGDGVTLLHNMMYIQAEERFNAAATADPGCAMAQWGIAMSNFHPLWPGTPSDAEIKRGQAAASDLATMPDGSAIEADMIAAASAFYAPGLEGYRARLASWAEAQIEAGSRHSDNIDAVALAALARIAMAPRGPGRIDVLSAVGDTLDAQHAKAPDHPGVIHYAIHAYDNPSLKMRGKPYAEIYDKTAPNAPHALHMPAHIFTRTGNWQESIDLNRRSAEAAMEQSSEVLQTHYVHAIDYMVYGHMQLGEYEEATRLVDEMMAMTNHQVSFGGAYALAASPVRLLLEQGKWSEAAALSQDMHPAIPWEKFPQTVAMNRFAKGIGAARSNDVDTAKEAAVELGGLRETMLERDQGYWARLTEAQILSIEAWIELAQGNEDLAILHQTSAADLEDEIGKSPVTPGHVLPARELLGDMLTQLNRTDEAQKAYEATLRLSPNRARSLAALQ